MAKEIEGVDSVLCDSSATVTVRMKKGKELTKARVGEIIKGAKKKWKIAKFTKEMRPFAKAKYIVQYSGST